MIVSWFRHKKSMKSAAASLYQASVSQSRDPRFYTDMGVADTLDGRFDLVSMHVGLIMARLRGEAEGEKLAQALFDHMFRSMDDTLREIGIGDLSVPRHMHRMMQAFNGRVHSYDTAINDNDLQGLEQAVIRNIYRMEDAPVAPGGAPMMAEYIVLTGGHLRQQDLKALSDGRVFFPTIPAMRKAHA